MPCRRSIIGTNIAANCDDVDDDMVDVVGDVIDNGPRGRTNDASLESVSILLFYGYTRKKTAATRPLPIRKSVKI